MVVRLRGVGRGRRRSRVCGEGRMSTLSLIASMSSKRSMKVMEREGNRADVEYGCMG